MFTYRYWQSELRGCVNREVGLGSHSLSHSSPVPNKLYAFCSRKAPLQKESIGPRAQELCEKSRWPSLIVLVVSVDVKQQKKKKCSASELRSCVKVEVAVMGSLVPNSPYGLCGRKTTFKEEDEVLARCP